MTPESHNQRGIQLAREGKRDEAIAALRAAIALRPAYARAYNNLGIVLTQQEHLAEAAAAFGAALTHQPDLAEAANNLGNLHAMQNRLEEATICFRHAIALKPAYAEALNNLGIALTELGRLTEAVAAFNEALRLRPGYADAHNNLGIARQFAGDIKGAVQSCEAALGAAPTGAAYLNLANLKRFTASDPQIATMEQLAACGAAMPDSSRAALHFALGKAYDDCRVQDRAFAHLLAGNTIKRKSVDYDEAATLAAMNHTRRIFDTALMQRLHSQGDTSATPIFILGMPRSGSTLVEQMLASHNEVFGAGERSDFSRLAQTLLAPGSYPDAAAELSPQKLRRLARRYLAAIRPQARGAARITDKMPGNFLYAGLIHLALPNARIIHTRRDAADTCFSCFAKLFRTGHAYSFDLAELGRYYHAYAKLMDHWRGVIPASVLIDVDYETLVADPRTETARILDHCGLAWDDSCLCFQRTERAVQTASATQVRQELHARSVGRWRPYADYLRPLLQELPWNSP